MMDFAKIFKDEEMSLQKYKKEKIERNKQRKKEIRFEPIEDLTNSNKR